MSGTSVDPENGPGQGTVTIPRINGPDFMWCSYCKRNICTDVGFKRGKRAWITFGIMALFLLWPWCLIPLFVNKCKDVQHSCPICQGVLYQHQRSCCLVGNG
ncbi:cell death-inducing p53-target protein 1 homolog [Synchiropus splendidus]|uniref:cell death-inducing p53-target protein 1 homolog n=1 Tax=Synchiropus splendidus TaxID=270530 RepID=UPI00237E5BDA|nr:cell death-inducing p53-target protein 1 homolog [Synchiropus splendidus]